MIKKGRSRSRLSLPIMRGWTHVTFICSDLPVPSARAPRLRATERPPTTTRWARVGSDRLHLPAIADTAISPLHYSELLATCMKRSVLRLLVLVLLSQVIWTVASTSAAVPVGAPNIVIFLADDSGWGDYSICGNRNLATPNIDSIARGGASLERFYVCALCAPTRAEFLTGRYHSRGGVRGVSTGLERLNTDERTFAEAFHAAP